MHDDEVTAGCDNVEVVGNQAVRIVLVRYEEQYAGKQKSQWLIEVDQPLRSRVVQDSVRMSHIGLRHHRSVVSL